MQERISKEEGRKLFPISASLSTKNQVTIPLKIRNILGMGKGDSIVFDLNEQNEVVVKAKKQENVDELFGLLEFKGEQGLSYEEIRSRTQEELSQNFKDKGKI